MTFISSLSTMSSVKTCDTCKGQIKEGEQRVCLKCEPKVIMCSTQCHSVHIAATHETPQATKVADVEWGAA